MGDGHVTLYAEGSTDEGGSFCYGATAGADLYATIQAPEPFGWKLPKSRFDIASTKPIDIVQRTCPIGSRDLMSTDLSGRDLSAISSIPFESTNASLTGTQDLGEPSGSLELVRRAQVYGPPDLFKVKKLSCPGGTAPGDFPCPLCGTGTPDGGSRLVIRAGDDDTCAFLPGRSDESTCSGLSARDVTPGIFDGNLSSGEALEFHPGLVKRAPKVLKWNEGGTRYDVDFGPYPECSVARNLGLVTKWYGFEEVGMSTNKCPTDIQKFTVAQIAPKDYQSKSSLAPAKVFCHLSLLSRSHIRSPDYTPIPRFPSWEPTVFNQHSHAQWLYRGELSLGVRSVGECNRE